MTIQRTRLATLDLTWFKSSYSTGNGGECVEVAWSKSSYSGDCIEVAAAGTHVHVRDSKQAGGPELTVGPGAWAGFVGSVAD